MILYEDLRHNFYGSAKRNGYFQHVLVIANTDVDAVCATQILLDLFSTDDVAYTLVPVSGWESFRTALRQHGEQAHSIVLFNCGATEPLLRYLRSGMTLYVIDSRRPLNLSNVRSISIVPVYYDKSIRLIVSKQEWEKLEIPDASDVDVSDSSSSESSEHDNDAEVEGVGSTTVGSDQVETARNGSDDNDNDDDVEKTNTEQPGGSHSRRRKEMSDVADYIGVREAKRRRRMEMKRRRDDILWKYYENSWYSASSAVLMLEVAQSIGRATVEMMWSAAVGIGSQLVEYLISHDCYTMVCFERLRTFRMKFCPDKSDIVRGDDILRLKFDYEIMLPLYSHWSLYTSMANNDFFYCLTHLWQQSGILALKSILAQLEVTLEESYQVYSALSTERKKDVFSRLYKRMGDEFASFTAHIGYSSKYNCCDFSRAMAGRLSYGLTEKEMPFDRFIGAQEILQKFMEGRDRSPLISAIDSYKDCLVSVVNLVSMTISQTLIVSVGSFYLLCLPQEIEDRPIRSRHFLFIFIHYVLRAFTVSSRFRNRGDRPLFVAIPMSGEDRGWFLITGLMPANTDYVDENQKSFIGRAIQKVVENYIHDGARRDFFDSSMVLIRSDQKARFFDGLQATLEIG